MSQPQPTASSQGGSKQQQLQQQPQQVNQPYVQNANQPRFTPPMTVPTSAVYNQPNPYAGMQQQQMRPVQMMPQQQVGQPQQMMYAAYTPQQMAAFQQQQQMLMAQQGMQYQAPMQGQPMVMPQQFVGQMRPMQQMPMQQPMQQASMQQIPMQQQYVAMPGQVTMQQQYQINPAQYQQFMMQQQQQMMLAQQQRMAQMQAMQAAGQMPLQQQTQMPIQQQPQMQYALQQPQQQQPVQQQQARIPAQVRQPLTDATIVQVAEVKSVAQPQATGQETMVVEAEEVVEIDNSAAADLGDIISQLQHGLGSMNSYDAKQSPQVSQERRRSSFVPPQQIGRARSGSNASSNSDMASSHKSFQTAPRKDSFTTAPRSPFDSASRLSDSSRREQVEAPGTPKQMLVPANVSSTPSLAGNRKSTIGASPLKQALQPDSPALSPQIQQESTPAPQKRVSTFSQQAVYPTISPSTLEAIRDLPGQFKLSPANWDVTVMVQARTGAADTPADDLRYAKFRSAIVEMLEEEIDYPLKVPQLLVQLSKEMSSQDY